LFPSSSSNEISIIWPTDKKVTKVTKHHDSHETVLTTTQTFKKYFHRNKGIKTTFSLIVSMLLLKVKANNALGKHLFWFEITSQLAKGI